MLGASVRERSVIRSRVGRVSRVVARLRLRTIRLRPILRVIRVTGAIELVLVRSVSWLPGTEHTGTSRLRHTLRYPRGVMLRLRVIVGLVHHKRIIWLIHYAGSLQNLEKNPAATQKLKKTYLHTSQHHVKPEQPCAFAILDAAQQFASSVASALIRRTYRSRKPNRFQVRSPNPPQEKLSLSCN
jgi:hypothetical protein